MKIVGLVATISSVVLMVGCTSFEEVNEVHLIKRLEATSGTPFTQALFQEYQALARVESEREVDWTDAALFARKGMRAGKGEVVAPEKVESWKIPADRVAALNGARARLTGYFADGAPERVPAAAARAQVKFDCWVEAEAQKVSSEACRSDFLKIEPSLVKPMPVVQTIPEYKHEISRYSVGFALGSAALTEASLKTLKDVVAAQANNRTYHIIVEGYADAVGNRGLNEALSRQRALAVADQLVSMGVVTPDISINAFGPVGSAAVDPERRRVDIVLEQGLWGYLGRPGTSYVADYTLPVYVVTFAVNSTQLSPESLEILKKAVAAQKELKPSRVLVEGYADRTGTSGANEKISRERAKAVADAIVKLGGDAGPIVTRWFGANANAYVSRNATEAERRRVEVIFDRW